MPVELAILARPRVRVAFAVTAMSVAACQPPPESSSPSSPNSPSSPVSPANPSSPTPPSASPAARFDVQAHRGDRGHLPPGNTIPAFESALAMEGLDTLEADMQITADGEVVIGHDDDLRETGCAWTGEAVNPRSLISQQQASEVAAWDCHPELPGIQAPPPLASLLALDPDIRLNLELKRTSTADADVYVTAILAYQRECGGCLDGRLTLQSFEWSALRHARERYGEQLEFRAAILDKRGELEAIAEARAYADIWSPTHELVTAERLASVHELGMLAIPWTVNDPERMRALIELGVDGMISDYPDRVLDLVRPR
jgi:glycerophosphoryl diester phosphodiesterase